MTFFLKKMLCRSKFSSPFITAILSFRQFFLIIILLSPFNVYSQSAQELSLLLFDPVPLPVNIELPLYENPVNPGWANTAQNIDVETSLNQTTDAVIGLYENSIQNFESEGGPYDARIAQELLAQAASFRVRGELDSAIQAFDRAAHITKINNGLFSSQQESIFSEIIDTHLLNGDLDSANVQYERLFYLQKKIYSEDDPQYLRVLNNYAEWNIRALNLRLGMNRDPSEQLLFAPIDRLSARDSEIRFITSRLINAQNIYLKLNQLVQDSSGLTDHRLLDIEKQLASTSYFFSSIAIIRSTPNISSSNQLGPSDFQSDVRRSPFSTIPKITLSATSYRRGYQALVQRIQYINEMENLPADALGKALIDLADWYFVFERAAHASSVYQEAYLELLANNMPSEQIELLFHPPTSVSLPTFVAPRYSRESYGIPADAQLQYRGYIDIEYRTSRLGSPRRIQVLGSSDNASIELQERLVLRLKRANFRPRFSANEEIRNELFQIRYYYTY